MPGTIEKLIDRLDGDPDWFQWAPEYETADEAIQAVKGYCIGPNSKFRVVNEDGNVIFAWSYEGMSGITE